MQDGFIFVFNKRFHFNFSPKKCILIDYCLIFQVFARLGKYFTNEFALHVVHYSHPADNIFNVA